jgi:hypothetical protein
MAWVSATRGDGLRMDVQSFREIAAWRAAAKASGCAVMAGMPAVTAVEDPL